jgi:hypothetical protein
MAVAVVEDAPEDVRQRMRRIVPGARAEDGGSLCSRLGPAGTLLRLRRDARHPRAGLRHGRVVRTRQHASRERL